MDKVHKEIERNTEDIEEDVSEEEGELEVDWSDIIPIEQDDGPNPIVSIAYNAEFKRLMGLFRAVIFKEELSLRVLSLTEEVLEINPANYTAWQYRRDCLKATGADLCDERRYMDNFAEDNPKNYQIWFHRRAIVELLGDGSMEKAFCEMVFDVDNKNYHAWAHRQWAITHFGLWEGELEFTDAMIKEDLRNNSAWNQRWFIVHNDTNHPITIDILQREIKFAIDSIALVANNESSWNYLRGLTRFHPELVSDIASRIDTMLLVPGYTMNSFAMSLLADIREKEGTMSSLTAAQTLMQQLVVYDKIRAKVWIRRGKEIVKAMERVM